MGRPSNGKTGKRARSDEEAQRRRVTSAQRASGAAGPSTPQTGLAALRKALRSKYSSKELQSVFADVADGRVNREVLDIQAAIIAAAVVEEVRLHQALLAEHESDAFKKGEDESLDRAAGISELLQEHRRHIRSMRGVANAMARLAKAARDVDAGSRPNAIEVTAKAIWADVDSVSAKAPSPPTVN